MITSFRIRLMLTLIVIASSGCASATNSAVRTPPQSSSSPVPSASPSGPRLSGTVSIAGAATIATTAFVTAAQLDAGEIQKPPPAGASCADYADGFQHIPGVVPHSFVPPVVQTSAFHNILVDVVMGAGYARPGTYDSAHVSSLRGNAVEGIGVGSTVAYTVFTSSDSGAMVLTVKADGSGSLRIEHWDSDEVRQSMGSSQVDISGIVNWVCED